MSKRDTGFTLAELAVVLLIVGLLVGGMMLPLAAQDDLRRNQETRQRLDEARAALLGFAAARDRLPCPALEGAMGTEAYAGTPGASPCSVAEGFLPAATLALGEVDAQGYALDAWQQRIRYAVTKANDNAFTFVRSGGMRSVGLGMLAPDLTVCASSPCASRLTDNAVAVIWSVGRNGADPARSGSGADERENPNPGSAGHPDPNPGRYVSHEPSPSSATGGEFDDLVVWLSPYILYGRMIAAGYLP